jgi:hypothetical protein
VKAHHKSQAFAVDVGGIAVRIQSRFPFHICCLFRQTLMLLSIKEIILPSQHMISEKLSDTSQLFIQQAESVAQASVAFTR